MQILALLISIVSLGCWIATIITAFRKGTVVMGVVSICPLVALILGWIKNKEWDHTMIMIIWSIAIVINIILNAAIAASAA